MFILAPFPPFLMAFGRMHWSLLQCCSPNAMASGCKGKGLSLKVGWPAHWTEASVLSMPMVLKTYAPMPGHFGALVSVHCPLAILATLSLPGSMWAYCTDPSHYLLGPGYDLKLSELSDFCTSTWPMLLKCRKQQLTANISGLIVLWPHRSDWHYCPDGLSVT